MTPEEVAAPTDLAAILAEVNALNAGPAFTPDMTGPQRHAERTRYWKAATNIARTRVPQLVRALADAQAEVAQAWKAHASRVGELALVDMRYQALEAERDDLQRRLNAVRALCDPFGAHVGAFCICPQVDTLAECDRHIREVQAVIRRAFDGTAPPIELSPGAFMELHDDGTAP